MLKTTKKSILSYLNDFNNLNKMNNDEIKKLQLENIALSFGVYGMNAGLFLSKTNGLYYVVPSRSTRLFQLA